MATNRKRQGGLGLAILTLMLAPGAAASQDGASEWNLHSGSRTNILQPAVQNPIAMEVVVTVRFLIDKKGGVSRCEVLKSSGHEDLDTRTCSTIEQRFKFEPKDENGKSTQGWRTQRVRYQITE